MRQADPSRFTAVSAGDPTNKERGYDHMIQGDTAILPLSRAHHFSGDNFSGDTIPSFPGTQYLIAMDLGDAISGTRYLIRRTHICRNQISKNHFPTVCSLCHTLSQSESCLRSRVLHPALSDCRSQPKGPPAWLRPILNFISFDRPGRRRQSPRQALKPGASIKLKLALLGLTFALKMMTDRYLGMVSHV